MSNVRSYKRYLEPNSEGKDREIPRKSKYRNSIKRCSSSAIPENRIATNEEDNDNRDVSTSTSSTIENQDKNCSMSADELFHNGEDISENQDKNCSMSANELFHDDEDISENQDKNSSMSADEPFHNDEISENQGIEEASDEEFDDSREDLHRKHNITISISKQDIFNLILAFSLRFKVSDTGILALINLINVIFNQNFLNASLYKLWKSFNVKSDKIITKHLFCEKCNMYLGSDKASKITCNICGNVISCNAEKSSCFLSLSLEKQIKGLIKKGCIKLPFVEDFNKNKKPVNEISDVNDGIMYKKMKEKTKSLFLTYNFSVDGMAIFNNAKGSLWPIFVIINEIPPAIRFDNILLAGLWFGKKEPKMDVYLKPFSEEAVKLANEGIMLEDSTLIRAFPACCCADSVARPCIQNTTQFNGYYGCSWCKHPGFAVNGTVKYPYKDNLLYADRTEGETIKLMFDAVALDKSVLGVKGPCAMLPVPFFNVVSSFVPDYMHGIFLGVTKTIVNSWFDARNKHREFYLGSTAIFKVIDERARKIVWPHSIGRIPRSIQEKNLFKANEWKNFLLYMCLPCMEGLLKKKYLKHISYLVGAVDLLMSNSISLEDLKYADKLLMKFVSKVQNLYGEEYMTHNVHLLLHYSTSVVNWGPLWCHSMFVFEGFNATIQSFIMGTTGIKSQSVRRFLLYRELISDDVNENSPVSDFIRKINKKSAFHKKYISIGNCILYGTPTTCLNNICDYNLPISFITQNGFNDNYFFKRMTVNNMLLTTSPKKQLKFSDNFIYTELIIGKIVFIALDHKSSTVKVCVLKYDVVVKPNKNVNMFVVKNLETYVVVNPHQIIGKCVEYDDGAGTVSIFKVPQTYELCT